MADFIDRLPPHDIEAEESVIAAAMVSDEALNECAPLLTGADFFRETNGWVWDAIRALWKDNHPVNTVSVAAELERRGHLDTLGGRAKLARMTADLGTSIGAAYYARLIHTAATHRRLLSVAGSIARLAYQGGTDATATLDSASRMVDALRTGAASGEWVSLRTLLDGYLDGAMAEADADGVVTTLRTGYSGLDTVLGGLKRSDLILLAARPSMGKSALSTGLARNAAIGQGARVALCNLEMSAESICLRLLAAESGVESSRLRLGTQTEADERRIMNAAGRLADCKIWVDDSPSLSVGQLRGKLQRLIAQHGGLDLVIVDYLQLMHADERSKDGNRVMEISAISRALKGLARELDVPLLALSQLSRAVESRKPPIPMLSDLRDSGALEQDADVVMLLYRDDYYAKGDDAAPSGIAQVIIAKHRNGPVGTVDLRFDARTASFTGFHEPSTAPQPLYE